MLMVPVAPTLLWRVRTLPLSAAVRRMTFAVPFTVVPLRLRTPAKPVLLLPIAKVLLRWLETSMAPIDKVDVPRLIPAVVAVPDLLNWAMSVVFQAVEPVLGDQLPAVYHAVELPVLPHAIVAAPVCWPVKSTSANRNPRCLLTTAISKLFPSLAEAERLEAAGTTGNTGDFISTKRGDESLQTGDDRPDCSSLKFICNWC